MKRRLYQLYIIIFGWQISAVALPLAMQQRLEQACNSYWHNMPHAPSKLVTCLRYFQDNALPARNSMIIGIMSELYAADIIFLNELSHISQKNACAGTSRNKLFPNNLNGIEKKLYYEAELLITRALQKL